MSTPIERSMRAALAAMALLTLSACVSPFRQPPPPGAPVAAVTAAMGRPAAVYPEADGGQILEYRGQPMGQFQHMARIGPDGRLISFEQVLTSENFGKVKVDQWTKDDILRHFGQPAEVSAVGFHNYEVWSYRYKESGVWNSMMHVHFDQQGVVRQMLNGPDPRYDDRFRRW
jgi:putative hemolysin